MDKMFLDVRGMAGKMGVSEKTIYRMLNDNQIAFAVKIGGQWRFRIDAVDGWLAAQSGTAASRQDRSLGHRGLGPGERRRALPDPRREP